MTTTADDVLHRDLPADQRIAALADKPMQVLGARRSTLQSLQEVWAYRELLQLLVKREIKVRYKDSSLGLLWSLIRPLVMLAVYYFAIGRFLGAQRAIPSFAIYVFTGLTAYQLFSEVISSCTSSILGNAGLVKKVSLPREVFPLSTVGSSLFNLGVQLVVLLAATVVAQQVPLGQRLVYLPLSLAVLLVYGVAAGLLLSALNVFLRDVQYLVEMSLVILFWTTPTVYSWGLVRDAGIPPLLETLYLCNPVAVAVLGMQRALWVAGDAAPTPDGLGVRLVVMLVVGCGLVYVAQRLFARLEGNFAQEL